MSQFRLSLFFCFIIIFSSCLLIISSSNNVVVQSQSTTLSENASSSTMTTTATTTTSIFTPSTSTIKPRTRTKTRSLSESGHCGYFELYFGVPFFTNKNITLKEAVARQTFTLPIFITLLAHVENGIIIFRPDDYIVNCSFCWFLYGFWYWSK